MSVSTAPAARTAELTFIAPPPGLDPLVEFQLAPVDAGIGLYTLRDRQGAGIRLFVSDPAVFVPEYTPVFTAEQLDSVGADGPADVDVFVVTLIADGTPIVNLLAPVIVHPVTGRAAQVILEDQSWPVQAELRRN